MTGIFSLILLFPSMLRAQNCLDFDGIDEARTFFPLSVHPNPGSGLFIIEDDD